MLKPGDIVVFQGPALNGLDEAVIWKDSESYIGISGSVFSNELCLVLARTRWDICILTSGGKIGWKSEKYFVGK